MIENNKTVERVLRTFFTRQFSNIVSKAYSWSATYSVDFPLVSECGLFTAHAPLHSTQNPPNVLARSCSPAAPLLVSQFSWCSGYHICLTHRRSPVRSRAKTFVPRGLTARISGFHPGGPGSTPGVGIHFAIMLDTCQARRGGRVVKALDC